MQVKVPQQLLQYEDKIIGPLTLKQFIFILMGLGIGTVVYYAFPPSVRIIGFILAIPAAALFFGMAFVRYNERGMDVYVQAAIEMFAKPRFRVWSREITLVPTEDLLPPKVTKAPKPIPKPQVTEIKTNLEQLAHVMDTRGFERRGRIYRPEEEATVKPYEDRILAPEAPAPAEDIEEAEALLREAEVETTELDDMIESAKAKFRTQVVEPNLGSIEAPPQPVVHQYERPELAETDYKDILDKAQKLMEEANNA